jgi:hypothetical protein
MNRALSTVPALDIANLSGAKKAIAPACLLPIWDIWYTT